MVRFTAKARELWVDWVNNHYKEQNASGFPEVLRGPWAKLEAYCARFALIFQMTRYASGCACASEIDESSLLKAITLVDYFKSHTERAYRYLRSNSDDRLIIDVLAHIYKTGGKISARDLQRKRFQGIKTADQAKAFLSKLADQGYGSIEVTKTNSFIFTRFPT